jgi:hypothetical protein
MLEKRPRHYAQELLNAKTDEQKRALFQKIPKHFRDLVLVHYSNWVSKTKSKQGKENF